MVAERGLYNTVSTIHNWYYPKRIALTFKTA